MRGRTISRTLAALALLLALVGGMLMMTSVQVARADVDICKDAPVPRKPDAGAPGMFTKRPDAIPAGTPDPFADPQVSIGSVYGYNWGWGNYALGCGNDFLRDPGAVTNTASGNQLLGFANLLMAGLDQLEQLAKNSPLDWLTPVISAIAGALKGLIFGTEGMPGWMGLALVAAAVLVAWRAKMGGYAETARTVLIVIISLALAAFTLLTPEKFSTGVDKVITSAAQAADSPFSQSAADGVARQSTYNAWLVGNFGSATSPSAVKYGPDLFKSMHYSWSEVQTMEKDPSAQARFDQAKAAQFKSIAASLEKDDPAAYEVLRGQGDRIGPAFAADVLVLLLGLYLFCALAILLVCRIMMQALTLVVPLAAVTSVVPLGQPALQKLWDLFTAAVLNAVKFTLCAGIMTVVLGALNGQGKGLGWTTLWVVVVTLVMFHFTKPLHAFKSVLPGVDANRSYLRDLKGFAMAAVAGRAGGKSVADDDDRTSSAASSDPSPTTGGGGGAVASDTIGAQQAREPMAALPAPQWVQASPMPSSAHSEAQAGDVGPQWSMAAAPAPIALGAGPVIQPVSPDQPRHAAEWTPRAELGPAPVRADGVTVETPGTVVVEVARQPNVASGSTTSVESSSAPVDRLSPTEVVHPTGIIIQSESTLYRPGEETRVEEYVRLPEPQMSPDGTEVPAGDEGVMYRSKESTNARS